MAVSTIDVKEIALRGSNLVVFGDSWSQPGITNSVDEYWVKRVASAFYMNRFNFAVAGAGFGRTDNNISGQIDTASSNMTASEKENTSIVIALIGYNDIINNVSDNAILAGVADFNQRCGAMFPNAKQILIPFAWAFGRLLSAYNIRIELLLHKIYGSLTYPCMVVPDARYWLMGVRGNYQNDSHPSELGYQRIAGRILGFILGNNYGYSSLGETLTLSHGNDKFCAYTFENGMIHFQLRCQFDSALSDYSDTFISNLPPICVPEVDIMVPIMRVGGLAVGNARLIVNASSLFISKLTVPANTFVYADATYRAVCNVAWS